LGTPQPEPTYLPVLFFENFSESGGTLLRVVFSHKDIANPVGASRPRVTEHLARLEREKFAAHAPDAEASFGFTLQASRKALNFKTHSAFRFEASHWTRGDDANFILPLILRNFRMVRKMRLTLSHEVLGKSHFEPAAAYAEPAARICYRAAMR